MKPLSPDDPPHVGSFRIVASLGAGGMGRVLLGFGPDGRFAAVKQVHPSFASDPGFRQRFRQEVDASRKVSGAYTAPILDADPDADTPWLATLYIAGPTLTDTVADTGPLPAPALKHLARSLATALADIHRAGLIHRDLKPSNVLLTHDGPRVIDFGIARATEGSDLTASGHLIGSPEYCSPEQAEGATLTPASDMFALGSVLAFAATGRGPFAAAGTPQTLYNVVRTQPDLREVPSPLRDLVQRCLAKDPEDRPEPEDLLDLLGPSTGARPWPEPVHDVIRDHETAARAALTTPPGNDGRATRRRRAAIIATVAALAVTGTTMAAANLLGPTENTGTAAENTTRTTSSTPTTTPRRADPLAADQLREVDPCRVRLGENLRRNTDRELDLSGEIGFDSCRYRKPNGFLVDLYIGPPSRTPGDADGLVEGLTVVVDRYRGSCELGVAAPADPDIEIRIEMSPPRGSLWDGNSCATGKAHLAEAIRSIRAGGVGWQAPSSTLATVDPCTLADDRTIERRHDTVSRSVRAGLHRCTWETSGAFTVELGHDFVGTDPNVQRRQRYLAEREPAMVDGQDAYQVRSDGGCLVGWTARPASGDALPEVVTVEFASARGDPGVLGRECAIAREFAATVLRRLPAA